MAFNIDNVEIAYVLFNNLFGVKETREEENKMTFNIDNVSMAYIVDVHNTLVAYATPGFGPEFIHQDTRVSPGTQEFRQSEEAVDTFNERHNVKTADEELATEEAAILKGLEHIAASSQSTPVIDKDAHYVIPIEKAYDSLMFMLRQEYAVVSIVSSSTVNQSRAVLDYILGEEYTEQCIGEGRLKFANAVHPLSDETPAMSKKDPETWRQSYVAAGLGEIKAQIKCVYIAENSAPKLDAAKEAAKDMFGIEANVAGTQRVDTIYNDIL
jgi:hypothetical protein